MKKKKVVSKLHLSKETLQNLTERDLAEAAGGITVSQSVDPSCPQTWRCC
jgi:hypothetical protein